MSAAVRLVSVKLQRASVHHTQEVKCERGGKAHCLSDLKNSRRSEEKLLNMKEKNTTTAITNTIHVAFTTNTKSLSH